jgi:peroxiredoxin
MAITVGSKAPDFSLVSDSKETVNLSDYRGKNLVVLFYPLAFTGVCTTELCTMRDDIANYNNMNADIVAISVDSPFVLEQFKAAQNLNFPLLSDFNKTASKDYDSLYDEFPAFGMKGVSKRSAFVIDKEGVVKYQEVCASPGDLPNFEAIKVTLSEIK